MEAITQIPRKNRQSDRYERFAREYVIDLDSTRAAKAAGYSGERATVTGAELVKKRKVRKLSDELISRRASRLDIKADRVVEELYRLAFSNMQDYTRVDEDGKPVLDLSAITRDKFAAVQEIREDTTGGAGDGERKQVIRTTLKLVNKTQPLELLMRHLGMLQEKIEIHHRITLERVLEARNRAMPKSRTAISL